MNDTMVIGNSSTNPSYNVKGSHYLLAAHLKIFIIDTPIMSLAFKMHDFFYSSSVILLSNVDYIHINLICNPCNI